MPRKGMKYKRRKIDHLLTLKAFETRMRLLPDETFNLIKDKWLCCFNVWDTVADEYIDREIEVRYGQNIDNHCWRLCKVARERNVPIRGVTSSRVLKGKRLAYLPESEMEHVYYVGGVMNFLDFKCNEIFIILSQDKRYVQSSEGTLWSYEQSSRDLWSYVENPGRR